MNQELDSDLHNFNRRCEVALPYILKPRTLDAERALLDAASPFRVYIDGLLKDHELSLPTLPHLAFRLNAQGPSLTSNAMEFVAVQPLTRELSTAECESVGATLALLNAVGIVDLHRNNFVFGMVEEAVRFVPIDVECHLQRFELSRCDFFPARKGHHDCCAGVSHLAKYVKSSGDKNAVLKFIRGYLRAHRVLEVHRQDVQQRFIQCLGPKPLTRIIYRNTDDYYQAIKQQDWQGFAAEEVTQLLRGDIPYFFRFLGEPALLYWSSPESYAATTTNLETYYQTTRPFGVGACQASVLEDLAMFSAFFMEFMPQDLVLEYRELRLLKKGSKMVFLVGAQATKLDYQQILQGTAA
jgi:hypothetical protein